MFIGSNVISWDNWLSPVLQKYGYIAVCNDLLDQVTEINQLKSGDTDGSYEFCVLPIPFLLINYV